MNKHYPKSTELSTIPDGFLEEWSITSDIYDNEWGTRLTKPYDNDINKPFVLDSSYKSSTGGKKNSTLSSNTFIPVSIILSLHYDFFLTKENSYEITFNTGVLEGSGISINSSGNIITFHNEGSYRFEISGDAIVFSDVPVNLVYFSSDFSDDIKDFSTTKIPHDDNKLSLHGIPTILPLHKNQSIIVKLIPESDEYIKLLSGTRLLIHKVA